MKPVRFILSAVLITAGLTMSTCEQPEIYTPQISEIIPAQVTAGQPFEITGNNLDFGTYVKIDTIKLPYQMQEEKALVFLPEDFPAGKYKLHIESVEGNSNKLPITILPAEIRINADAEVNVGDSLTIFGKDFVAPIQVILCSESADSITIENPSIKSENQIKIFIPIDLAFDRDSKNCNIEIISNSVKSTSIAITINNPKNPKLTTTAFAEVVEKDTITLLGEHLSEEELKITIDGIAIANPIISGPTSLKVIIPPGISEVGKIVLGTKYGIVEADYSKDDTSNRIPMIDADNPTEVYSDDSLKIRGRNFLRYPMEVFLSTDVSPKTLLANSTYQIVNDALLMIALPENISKGDVVLENDYGESSPYHFDVLTPPILQTSLPKSNPANGPLYIYGQNLLSASTIIFKSINTNQETEISNIERFSRCFDPARDTCDIIGLNIPNLAPGNYEIFVAIKKAEKEIKRSKAPLPFRILADYGGNILAGSGNTNIVFPNPPVGTPIASVQNSWYILNTSERYQLIEPETPAINGVQDIYDDFNNKIGKYRRDASYVEMELQGIHYFGQFDNSYLENDQQFYVRKMVLIPEELGNVVILIDKNTAIDSLNRSEFHAGENIIAYGHFLDTSYELVFQKQGSNDQTFIIEDFTNTTLSLILPEDIPSGTYDIYAFGINFGFNSNRKTIKIMEK